MASQVQDIREKALAEIFSEFEQKLESSIASFKDSDISDQDIDIVRNKFKNSFQNYFTTGFDTVFQKELVDKFKDSEEVEILNLSVTDEDLNKLDETNNRNALFRKVVPPKCNYFLEKALKIQNESLVKIKSKVHAVEPISEVSNIEEQEEKSPAVELNKEFTELDSELKNNFDRLKRLENAQSIILSNQNGGGQ